MNPYRTSKEVDKVFGPEKKKLKMKNIKIHPTIYFIMVVMVLSLAGFSCDHLNDKSGPGHLTATSWGVSIGLLTFSVYLLIIGIVKSIDRYENKDK